MQEQAEPTTIEETAAQMKVLARTRALAGQTEKQPRRRREPVEATPGAEAAPKAPRRPRRVGPRRETGPEAALRKAIIEHEREIKRLNRALRAIGAA